MSTNPFYDNWLDRVDGYFRHQFNGRGLKDVCSRSYNWEIDYELGYDPNEAFNRYLEIRRLKH